MIGTLGRRSWFDARQRPWSVVACRPAGSYPAWWKGGGIRPPGRPADPASTSNATAGFEPGGLRVRCTDADRVPLAVSRTGDALRFEDAIRRARADRAGDRYAAAAASLARLSRLDRGGVRGRKRAAGRRRGDAAGGPLARPRICGNPTAFGDPHGRAGTERRCQEPYGSGWWVLSRRCRAAAGEALAGTTTYAGTGPTSSARSGHRATPNLEILQAPWPATASWEATTPRAASPAETSGPRRHWST